MKTGREEQEEEEERRRKKVKQGRREGSRGREDKILREQPQTC